MIDVIVVGSGPNGLAGAVALARQGLTVTVLEAAETIGGGTRSGELTVPGVLHDHCSAVHPMAVASPFLASLPLDQHGLTWTWAPVELAHPLDGGRGAALYRSIERTAAALGDDGATWRRLFGPLAADFDTLATDLLGPVLRVPRHPVRLGRFGLRAAAPASALARLWRTAESRALFAGTAAHAMRPLHTPGSTAIGAMLIAAGHRHGWPVARGGSRAITDALARHLFELGGTIQTGALVRSLADLPPARVVLLDVAPSAAARICGDRLPPRVARAYRRWRHGPAAFKVDLAVEGGVPWRLEAARQAGTVHVGGELNEIAYAERQVTDGRLPTRPFVLVAQQYLADPARSQGDIHPVYAYAHVPSGWDGDATDAVLDQIERFAPGLRERIVARSVHTVSQFSGGNPNYVRGDILTGANTPAQLVARPRWAIDPYATGVPGVFLCSAATPPGAGVHGMCGYQAARSALRHIQSTKSLAAR
ncbi:FAD-dependent oxidoreductase [Actinoplanes sp. SE50]|uniref:phytoene desaturase family protein n=1 Tax=unclassified Actinoplanes TaxID=2626549 RepID=UPI00023EBDE9|nr:MULTISPECIES: NAD(P)/FAD-dependent oxidoreductase [unclassified Actinoplanes]AEV86903.1 dehydrogenase [Actinoplanes sp. SE50/110]ATO85300.1 FAD-dependent oxidoreductase [Actinoplanes sp. SE50]SLM02710.1 FAD-dependent oxidoreductase [Actinoplanes sp. SE50/110]